MWEITKNECTDYRVILISPFNKHHMSVRLYFLASIFISEKGLNELMKGHFIVDLDQNIFKIFLICLKFPSVFNTKLVFYEIIFLFHFLSQIFQLHYYNFLFKKNTRKKFLINFKLFNTHFMYRHQHHLIHFIIYLMAKYTYILCICKYIFLKYFSVVV